MPSGDTTMDGATDPPIAVWKMLSDPILTIFQDGIDQSRDVITRVISVIQNSCREKQNWYIPLSLTDKALHGGALQQDQEYTAFCTWLLGRFFYFLQKDGISDIHPLCVETQILILQLFSQNRYMLQFFFKEYLESLTDLVEIQMAGRLFEDGPYLMKRFTPLSLDTLSELNLTPMYVLVHTHSLLKRMEKYLVQIVISMVENVIQTNEEFVTPLWSVMSKLLWLALPSVKAQVISVFVTVIHRVGYPGEYSMMELCKGLETLVKTCLKQQFLNTSSVDSLPLISRGVGQLFHAIIESGGSTNSDVIDRQLFSIAQLIVTGWGTENSSDPVLHSASLLVVRVLKKLPRGSVDLDSFSILINKWQTHTLPLEILETWLLHQMQDFLDSEKPNFMSLKNDCCNQFEKDLPVLCVVTASPAWATFHQQLTEDVMEVQKFLSPDKQQQEYALARNLAAKIQVLVRCAIGCEIALAHQPEMQKHHCIIDFFKGQLGEFLIQLKTILALVAELNWHNPSDPDLISIVRSVILTVAYLMLMPGTCSEADAQLGVSIVSFPWLSCGPLHDLELDSAVVALRSKCYISKWKDLRPSCLRALANVPHSIAPQWRASLFVRTLEDYSKRDPKAQGLVTEAIYSFPALLSDPSQHPPELLENFLLPILHSEDPGVLIPLSTIFSEVVCILSGNYIFTRVKDASSEPRVGHICKTCHKNAPSFPSQGSNHLNSATKILMSFMALIESPISEVRCNMAASLGSLVLHLPVMYQSDMVIKWMKYVQDSDSKVRVTFSQMVKFLIFHRDWMEGKEVESENLQEEHIPLTQIDRAELSLSRPRMGKVLAMLFKALNACLQEKDHNHVDTMLATIVNIGCVPLDCVLLPVLKMVVACVSHPTFRNAAIAHVYLKQIADAHNTKVENLYVRFRSDLCQHLIALVGMNFHQRSNWITVMDKVVNGFGFKSVASWIGESAKQVFPELLVLVVKYKDEKFLKVIMEILHTDSASLVDNYFQYIYPHVFLNEGDEVVDELVALMEKMSGLTAQELLIHSFKTIHNVFLLHYHCKKERVHKGICKLVNVLAEKESAPHKSSLTTAEIAEHVKPRFLGVLVHFDNAFEAVSLEEEVKIKALQSLPEIIKLLGPKYITPVRFKVLSTLRTALRLTHCDFPHLSCSAWEAFIHSVELNMLGSLLGTVVASLLPLLDQFPEEVGKIFRWLVVEHETDLASNIPDLFFLPDKPVIQDVYRVTQRYLNLKNQVSSDSQNVAELLKQPLPFISHDNVDIRRHGLQHLRSVLKEKQDKITNCLLREEVVNPDIAQLLNTLVVGCRDPDPDIQLLCAENLGMLGAIDPGHLPRKIRKNDTPHSFIDVELDQFGCQALTVLARAYHGARHTRNMDAFALAIQDLLKFYNISSSPHNPKKHLWNSFPDNIQQVMIPLEDSCYIMASAELPVWPHPLFGTRHAATLPRWAHCWACRLLTYIEHPTAKKIFTSCSLSLRTDINCVLFFLPIIVLHAVFPGNEKHHKMIEEEMSFVVQQRRTDEQDDSTTQVDSQHMKFRVRTDKFSSLSENVDSDSATHALCAKTVFSIIDFIEKWVGWSRKQGDVKRKEKSLSEENIFNVQKFLARFSKLDLAYGNYGVKEYARALMYLEDYLMDQPNEINEHLSFLGRIYAQLNEPDGIKGVQAIRLSQPTLLEMIVYHEVTDQHQEALACYELLAQQHSSSELGLRIKKGMVRCCLSLDQPIAARRIAEGVMSESLESCSTFLEDQAECFWRLHSFENLETVINDPRLEKSSAWGVSIGRCIIDVRKGCTEKLMEDLQKTRILLSKALSTASLEQGSFLQGYPHIIKLHILQELEAACGVIALLQSPISKEEECLTAVQHMVQVWEDRLEMVQMTANVKEPLLRLRRCVLELASSFVKAGQDRLSQLLNKALGHSWLKSAEVARTATCFQQAYVYLLNADKYKTKRHFIELAKLHWEKGMHEHAFSALRCGLEEHFPNHKELCNMDSKMHTDDRKICAEAKLLIAMYDDEKSNVEVSVNISQYREAVDAYPEWEKSHASLAQYYDRMAELHDEDSRDVGYPGDLQVFALHSFAKSMRYGCEYVYQSMSRMLSIWFDFGARYHSLHASFSSNSSSSVKNDVQTKLKERKGILLRMNKIISSYVEKLQPYMFMTGFSQLVSRICHPVPEVYDVIKSIIVKLLTCYPQQTMWMLLVMHRSSSPLRRQRCQAVLDDSRIRGVPGLLKLTSDFTNLGSLLIDLCHKPVAQNLTRTTVTYIVKELPRVLANPNFSEIMVPLQHSRSLILPQPDYSAMDSHIPYAVKPPSISGIKDEVIILNSIQKPRKITLRGSDGKSYGMMCKDRDDLRLDASVMEFSSIVNKYLQKDPASRSRGLNIRTYSVVPLNEDCGVIEWVPNLVGYRVILTQFYKEMGCPTSAREIKKYIVEKQAPLKDKRDMYLNNLIPLHPPVFRYWFRNNFTDSRSWYEARKSYVHTTAVMSMVGYILGLGDRHGENILLDTTCGDVVHVDYNCLFNKGESFEYPERVPFRLTHNMVSAMGPTGVEGPFRHACEITLKVLRDWHCILLSVLRPFVYDPLAAWRKKSTATGRGLAQGETANDKAVENLHNIRLRLTGCNNKKIPTALSVEGQTAFLIQDATNVDNLCQMYVGWGAYM